MITASDVPQSELDRGRKKARRRYPEQQLQKAVIQWARYFRMPWSPVKARPMLGDWLTHIPNERGNATERQILAAMGVQPGASDLLLPLPALCQVDAPSDNAELFIGLWLELKAPKNRPTELQFKWLDAMKAAGYMVAWSSDFEHARTVLTCYANAVASSDKWR